MKVLVDTNVFIASLVDEPERGEVATEFLNQEHEYATSMLNLMELRTVLTKKKRVDQNRVEETLVDITDRIDVYSPDRSDFIRAYEMQRENLLYTVDCVLLALAEDIDARLVTFDAELLANGAIAPEDI